MLEGKQVYLDNSAATRLDERVLEAMKPYFFEDYAVATSEFAYSQGIEASEALNTARESLAAALGASPEEFIFTSGSTESSNTALKGIAAALGEKKGKHMLYSSIDAACCYRLSLTIVNICDMLFLEYLYLILYEMTYVPL